MPRLTPIFEFLRVHEYVSEQHIHCERGQCQHTAMRIFVFVLLRSEHYVWAEALRPKLRQQQLLY